MAKPIKETPFLKGKDAQRFNEERNSPKDREAIAREKERILKNYNQLKSAENRDRRVQA